MNIKLLEKRRVCILLQENASVLTCCGFFVFVRRLGVPQRVPGLSGSDGVRCLAGGSLWRLWLVSTQAGESTNTQRISHWFHHLKREKRVSFHP